MRILLDMDGVAVDFHGGVCKHFDVSRTRFEALREPGVYDCIPALSKCLGLATPLTATEFWRHIDKGGEDFWNDLEPLPWFDGLIELVSKIDPMYEIASSPPLSICGYVGKIKWLRARLGPTLNRFTLRSDKTLLAHPTHLLIDDHEETVNAFINKGGDALLFPSMGNSLHEYAADPITYLKGLL